MIKQRMFAPIGNIMICVIELIPIDYIKGKIMFITGYGQSKAGYFCMNLKMAKILCENGYYCVLYDHPGVGDSIGNLQDYTWRDYKEIAKKVTEKFLKDSENRYYLSFGIGTNIALQLSCLYGGKVIGISNWLLKYPDLKKERNSLDEYIEIRKMFENPYYSNFIHILGGYKKYIGGLIAKTDFFSELAKEISIADNIRDYCNICLFFAEHDVTFKVKRQMIELRTVKERGGQIVLISGADRFFSFADWQDQLICHIVSWVDTGVVKSNFEYVYKIESE